MGGCFLNQQPNVKLQMADSYSRKAKAKSQSHAETKPQPRSQLQQNSIVNLSKQAHKVNWAQVQKPQGPIIRRIRQSRSQVIIEDIEQQNQQSSQLDSEARPIHMIQRRDISEPCIPLREIVVNEQQLRKRDQFARPSKQNFGKSQRQSRWQNKEVIVGHSQVYERSELSQSMEALPCLSDLSVQRSVLYEIRKRECQQYDLTALCLGLKIRQTELPIKPAQEQEQDEWEDSDLQQEEEGRASLVQWRDRKVTRDFVL